MYLTSSVRSYFQEHGTYTSTSWTRRHTRCRAEKPHAPAIRWSEADIQATVTWVGKRNEKGVAVNYEAWTAGNHTEEAGRMIPLSLEGK